MFRHSYKYITGFNFHYNIYTRVWCTPKLMNIYIDSLHLQIEELANEEPRKSRVRVFQSYLLHTYVNYKNTPFHW